MHCNSVFNILIFSHTGKSSAIQYAAQDPLEQLDLTNAIISKTASSRLVKLLANKKKAMILSPVLFDILHNLLKSDEETASGDMQLPLLYRRKQGDPFEYAFLPPRIHATGERGQIDRSHEPRTRPGRQNSSRNPTCPLPDPYPNGERHRSAINRSSV